MNNMEEKLWNYIDGTCSPEERDAVALLIAQDEIWRNSYQEMLTFNNEITAITPDEPSMAFSYKVMEGIRTHEAIKPLKTTINTYIISGIAVFFVLSILGIVLFGFTGATQTISNGNTVTNIHLPDLSVFTNSTVMNVFLYVDVMLLLFFADVWLRKGRNNTKIKSVQN